MTEKTIDLDWWLREKIAHWEDFCSRHNNFKFDTQLLAFKTPQADRAELKRLRQKAAGQ